VFIVVEGGERKKSSADYADYTAFFETKELTALEESA